MGVVIKVENLSKQYRLGDVGTGSLKDDFKRFRYRMMGKEDPFLKIGEENDRTKKSGSDYVWALRDINFEVQQGDVVGIIGRNGAGKSTLLKILSRTTAPTTGSVKVKGRIASLLEVGTGFHGELSGRENIYLNGAIMGLRKWEIDKKLDEIIDFAGVDRYLDTPVKRYSSGMYVRLAFAVAAHLEPDILIVDEVLAVGDAEFQKKCLGKMKDVSQGQGRTVLFVSHNMGTIQSLCSNGLYMKNGRILHVDSIENIINYYGIDSTYNSKIKLENIIERRGAGPLRLVDIAGYNRHQNPSNIFLSGENIQFELSFKNFSKNNRIKGRLDVGINNQKGVRVAWISTFIFREYIFIDNNNRVFFDIHKLTLMPGSYNLNIYCEVESEVSDWLENVYSFEVIKSDYYKTGKTVPDGQGHVLLDYEIN